MLNFWLLKDSLGHYLACKIWLIETVHLSSLRDGGSGGGNECRAENKTCCLKEGHAFGRRVIWSPDFAVSPSSFHYPFSSSCLLCRRMWLFQIRLMRTEQSAFFSSSWIPLIVYCFTYFWFLGKCKFLEGRHCLSFVLVSYPSHSPISGRLDWIGLPVLQIEL